MAHRVAIGKDATTVEIPAFQMPLTPKADRRRGTRPWTREGQPWKPRKLHACL